MRNKSTSITGHSRLPLTSDLSDRENRLSFARPFRHLLALGAGLLVFRLAAEPIVRGYLRESLTIACVVAAVCAVLRFTRRKAPA